MPRHRGVMASVSQRRAAVAMVNVSSVENVFDDDLVVAGSIGGVAIRSAGSTLDTKRGNARRHEWRNVLHHHRTQIRTTDADVDDGADPLQFSESSPLRRRSVKAPIASRARHVRR